MCTSMVFSHDLYTCASYDINGQHYNNYIYSMSPSCPFDIAHTIFKPYISPPQFIHRLKSAKRD